MEVGNQYRMMSFVGKTARIFDPDPAHSEQVATLALALFDGLRFLHGYGSGERRLLEVAGLLHDIGWSRDRAGKHHKVSGDMIRELPIPGLPARDRFLCALVARYHRKALPDASRHRRFKSLDNGRRTVVEWLAGMLRVADGLDCNHTSIIKGLTCIVDSKMVAIRLEVKGNCRRAIERANQKQELLTKKVARKITYQC